MANERLYQFPSKPTPVPADIIYLGDSANGFNECNSTIAQIISAYPNLSGIAALTLGANTYPYSNNSAALTAGSITTLGVSLLADSTIAAMQGTLGFTPIPAASIFAGWDANKNLSANNFISAYTTTATAGATTTLVVGSTFQQYFTGSTTQTVLLPVTSTLALGQSFYIVNNSSGAVTVQSSGGNNIQVMGASTTLLVTCILTSGTTAASWAAEYVGESSGGTVNSGTINQLAWYAGTGNAVSGLATANSGVLVTSAGGVPSISSTLPSGMAATNLTLTTPVLGTPQSGNLSNCTAYAATSLSGLGTGVGTALGQAVTGSGSIVLSTSPTLVTPVLGTPTSGTLTTCTGYTIANLADVAWTGFTPGWTGFSANPSGVSARYKIIGKTCFVTIDGTAGTSNATTFTMTGLPATSVAEEQYISVCRAINNSAAVFNCYGKIASGDTTITFFIADSASGWTAAIAKMAFLNFNYEIA